MHKKKEFPYQMFIVLLLFFEIVFYLISGVCNIPDVTIINLEESLIYSFMHPLEAWNDKTISFLCIGFLVWFALVAYYMQYHRNYHPNLYGSAEWRDVHEANKCYMDKDDKHNRILTQNLKVSLRHGLANNNMAVIASSGDFKTTSLVEQNALQFGSTYVFLDLKGELLRKLGNSFKLAGYDVRSLNFNEPHLSDRYNPFVYIETELDILRVVKTLHESCRPMKAEQSAAADPFWDDAVKLLLQALFYAVWLEGRNSGKVGTINRLNELLNMESSNKIDPVTEEKISELQIYMDELASKYGADYPPVRDYRGLKEGAPDTVRSVVLMLRGMLQICNTAEVKRIFEDNDINIRELGTGVNGNPNKKVALFLVMPAVNNAYNWIINMFYDQSFDILQRLSNFEIKGPLPVRIEWWMDEIYAGPKPTDLLELLGIVRGWNMCIVLILQSVAQMEDMWKGPKWKVVKDNLSVVLFLGSGPFASETHEAISKATGTGTFDLVTDNVHLGTNSNSGLNWSQKDRPLMTPDDVKTMPETDAIVFIKSSQPIYDVKAIPFDKSEYGYKAPNWLKSRYKKALSMGNYEHPVYTFYDAAHFHYITINKDEPFQIYKDKRDIEALQLEAMTNKDVYTFTVNKEELLYLSWGKPAYTQENIEKMYHKIMEDEKIRSETLTGLLVLQDVDRVGLNYLGTDINFTINKDGWEQFKTFKALIENHWKDLTVPEQEEICFAMNEGLTEEQLRILMLRPLSEMSSMRRAFVLENKGKG